MRLVSEQLPNDIHGAAVRVEQALDAKICLLYSFIWGDVGNWYDDIVPPVSDIEQSPAAHERPIRSTLLRTRGRGILASFRVTSPPDNGMSVRQGLQRDM